MTKFAVLTFGVLFMSGFAHADTSCGRVVSIKTRTLPAAAPDYSTYNQGTPVTPSPTAVTIVSLVDNGRPATNLSFNTGALSDREFEIVTSAAAAKARLCYDNVTYDFTVTY